MMSPFFFFLIIYVIFSKNIIECTNDEVPQTNDLGEKEAAKAELQNEPTPANGQTLEQEVQSATQREVTAEPEGKSENGVTTSAVASPAAPQDAPLDSREANPNQADHQNGGADLPEEALNVTVRGANGDAGTSGDSAAALKNATSVNMPIKSALLKKNTGVKVTGKCGNYFQLSFVPHMTLNFETDDGKIELEQKFAASEIININFTKKCQNEQTFKFIAVIKDDILTLKWEVTDSTEPKKEMKKYRIPKFEKPITSIQVHTGNSTANIIESKNYAIKNAIPEKCDAITTECFLSGNLDIAKCFHCTLLARNTDTSNECFNYVSPDNKAKFEQSIITESSDEDSNEFKLEETIDNIMKKIYKTDPISKKKELITLEDFNDELREEIRNYCDLLKEVDVSGTLENHELGNETEVFNNLTRLLRAHDEQRDTTLPNKLKNAAICIKNVDEWIINKRGLVLPEVTNEYFNNVKDMPEVENEEEYEKIINVTEDMYEKDENDIIDLTKKDKEVKLLSPYFIPNKYCNDEYCDRWKDNTSCISKIEVEEQGHCGVCWVFASKLHLETIRCMRGYGHFRSSALYVANCSKRKAKYRCIVGSSPIEFLQIIDETKFLPLESDHPYSYTDVGKDCPQPKKKWVNLWGSTKLLEYVNYSQFTYSKGYIAYESAKYTNIDTFIGIVKREIQNKGSVIAYIKAENVFGYDLNGKGVHSLCGYKHPDHAATIIGYGKYINIKGEKRSYWLVRNSWGYYWGDEGNFKIDMHGPSTCKYNFIHTALVFKVNLGMVELPDEKSAPNPFNYFLKNGPEFYHRLYYKNFSPLKSKNLSKKNENNEEDQTNFTNNEDNGNDKTDLGENPQIYGTDNDVLTAEAAAVAAVSQKETIRHILKDIKNKRIKSSLISYADEDDIGKEHSCSRTYSSDPAKDAECKQFCVQNFDKCKSQYSPGYCLTKLKKTDECFFCAV